MRCPDCGARNGATAAWCTQCYRSLASEPPASEATTDELPIATDAVGPEPDGADPADPDPVAAGPADDAAVAAGLADADGDGVRTRDGEVQWCCPACEQWCGLTEPVCGVCGTARPGFEAPLARRSPRRDVTPAAVVAASVVLPGAGHLLLGRVGTGTARLLLALLWGLGGVAMARDPAALGPALVLLAGAFAIWIGSLLDVRSQLAGVDREVLTSRTLLWLVVGVTVALVATLLLVAASGVA